MDNKASKNRTLEMAFLVDAELLRRLAVVLAEVGEPLEYKVKFSDDMGVEYGNVEEVIQQPNTRQRSIVSITASTPGAREESAYVVLRTTPSPRVEYTVNGPQQRVIYLVASWMTGRQRFGSGIHHFSQSFQPCWLFLSLCTHQSFYGNTWLHVSYPRQLHRARPIRGLEAPQ